MTAAWVDLTPEEYHARTGPVRLSQSIAHRLIDQSPLHAKRAIDRTDNETTKET